jgi:hypothetical protein
LGFLHPEVRNSRVVFKRTKLVNNHFVIITVEIDYSRSLIVHTLYIPKYCKFFKVHLPTDFSDSLVSSRLLAIQHLLPKYQYKIFLSHIRANQVPDNATPRNRLLMQRSHTFKVPLRRMNPSKTVYRYPTPLQFQQGDSPKREQARAAAPL